jgi:hypothetical protein
MDSSDTSFVVVMVVVLVTVGLLTLIGQHLSNKHKERMAAVGGRPVQPPAVPTPGVSPTPQPQPPAFPAPAARTALRVCPHCQRQIPTDAALCCYCGARQV